MSDFIPTYIGGLGPVMLGPHRHEYYERVPHYEACRVQSMRAHLRAGDRLLDIGSEQGDMSVLFASWGVHTFLVEPSPRAWPWIRQNYQANDVYHSGWYMGLLGSEENGIHPDLDPPDLYEWPSCSYDDADPEALFWDLGNQSETAPVITLDQLVNVSGFEPTAITMDVEGGELHVIQGAICTLRDLRPTVWISEHEEFMAHWHGQTLDELHELMDDLGYKRTFLCYQHEGHNLYVPKERA